MKKILMVVVLLFLVLAFTLFLTKDLIAKVIIERGVKEATGLQIKMDGLSLGLFDGSVNIDNLRLYNPQGYEDEVMIDVPNIYIHSSLPKALRGEFHFYDMNLHLREFAIVRNSQGRLNLEALRAVQISKKETPKEKDKKLEVGIDKLTLRVDKATYKDYSRADQPRVREFNINLSETYQNVNNLYELINLIVVRVFANTALAGLTGFDSGELEEMMPSVTDATEAATEAAEQIKERLRLPLFGQ